jgi:threonine dehydratase
MDLLKAIQLAQKQLPSTIQPTYLNQNLNLSTRYDAAVLLKREDLQIVRSYKIRGAYNKMNSLTTIEKDRGIICVSAGNHAQSVAFCCQLLKIMGKIYMPQNTPKHKLKQVQQLGKNYVKIILVGDVFDDAYAIAMGDASIHQKVFIHPFDDLKIIAGKGTLGIEILEQYIKPIDYIFVPIEGGALAAGISTVFKNLSPNTKIIGVKIQSNSPAGIPIQNENEILIDPIDQFLYDTSHKKKVNLVSELCQANLTEIIQIPEGKVCSTIMQLVREQGIIVDSTGALSVAALDLYAEQIKGKNIVCILSGGTKNLERETEIKERSLLYEGLVHYL